MKIITINHTIEHLVDPEKVIKKLKIKLGQMELLMDKPPQQILLKKNYLKILVGISFPKTYCYFLKGWVEKFKFEGWDGKNYN